MGSVDDSEDHFFDPVAQFGAPAPRDAIGGPREWILVPPQVPVGRPGLVEFLVQLLLVHRRTGFTGRDWDQPAVS
jgi:hypothetical protein